MNNSCPICGGQTKQVPSHRFGAGYYECIEAGRKGCDRFFREDELVSIPAIPAEWFVIDEVREVTKETWERALEMLAPTKHVLAGEGAGPLQRPVHFITTPRTRHCADSPRHYTGFPAGRQDSES